MDFELIAVGISLASALYGLITAKKKKKVDLIPPTDEECQGLKVEKQQGSLVIQVNLPQMSIKPLFHETWGDADWETVYSGDPQLDKKRTIKASSIRYLALLDQKTRYFICKYKFTIDAYAIRRVGSGVEKDVAFEYGAIKLVNRLRNTNLVEAACDNLNDPVIGIRQTNLKILLDFESKDEKVLEKVKPFLTDPDPHCRLFAAQIMDDHQVLIELVHENRLSKEALKVLVQLPKNQTDQVFCDFLTQDLAEDAIIFIIDALGTRKRKEMAEPMIQLAETSPNELIKETVAKALEAFGSGPGSGDFQSFLLSLLNSKKITTQTAAARALGNNGDLSAVEPMYQLLQENPKEPLRTALDSSIRRIQGKLAHGHRGGLSVNHQEDRGHLSIAVPNDGKLSLSENNNASE